jgi:hypothetical protein
VLEGDSRDVAQEESIIEEQRRRLREVYLDFGQMNPDEYKKRYAELDRRVAELRARHDGGAAVEEMTDMLRDLPGVYASADERQRNKLVGQVFRDLLIDNQEMVAVRVQPAIDAMLRARMALPTEELAGAHSSDCRDSSSERAIGLETTLPEVYVFGAAAFHEPPKAQP